MPDDRSIPRRGLLRGAGLAGAASLAGCAGSIPGFGASTPDASRGGAVTGWAWAEAADALQSTVEPYQQQAGPDAAVAIERVDHEAMMEQFRPALVSGSGAPDLSLLESVVAPAFVNTGGLVDLTDRIDAEMEAQFVSGSWQAVTGSDDGIYAVPWDIGPVAVFYRRDVYEEHGIDPSGIETWEQFVAAGTKLPDGVHMSNLPPNDLDGVWRRQFRQLGGQAFTEDGAVDVDSEESLRVARNLKRMADEEIAASVESWGTEWFDRYRAGDIASLPAGPWMEAVLRDELDGTAGDWGVFALPAFAGDDNHATNWGGSNLCITEQSERVEGAWDYVRWAMTSPSVQNAMYGEFGIFPALEPAYESALYDEEIAFFDDQPIRRTFADLAVDVPGYRFTVDTPAVSQAMNTFLGRMLEGEISPRTAVDEAASQVADQTGRERA